MDLSIDGIPMPVYEARSPGLHTMPREIIREIAGYLVGANASFPSIDANLAGSEQVAGLAYRRSNLWTESEMGDPNVSTRDPNRDLVHLAMTNKRIFWACRDMPCRSVSINDIRATAINRCPGAHRSIAQRVARVVKTCRDYFINHPKAEERRRRLMTPLWEQIYKLAVSGDFGRLECSPYSLGFLHNLESLEITGSSEYMLHRGGSQSVMYPLRARRPIIPLDCGHFLKRLLSLRRLSFRDILINIDDFPDLSQVKELHIYRSSTSYPWWKEESGPDPFFRKFSSLETLVISESPDLLPVVNFWPFRSTLTTLAWAPSGRGFGEFPTLRCLQGLRHLKQFHFPGILRRSPGTAEYSNLAATVESIEFDCEPGGLEEEHLKQVPGYWIKRYLQCIKRECGNVFTKVRLVDLRSLRASRIGRSQLIQTKFENGAKHLQAKLGITLLHDDFTPLPVSTDLDG